MDYEFDQMSRQELETTRRRIADDLEDFDEMALFHSVNSPAHATSTERKRDSLKRSRMEEAIAQIDALLAAPVAE